MTSRSVVFDTRRYFKLAIAVTRRAPVTPVLVVGRPVVLDASFRSRSLRADARVVAKRAGVPFRLVECRAPAAAYRERLRRLENGESVSDGRPAVFDDFAARFEAIDELSSAEQSCSTRLFPGMRPWRHCGERFPCGPHGLVA